MSWGVFISYLSLLQSKDLHEVFILSSDKLLHLGGYCLLSLLATLAHYFSNSRKFLSKISLRTISGLSILLGGVLELAQEHYIPGRTGDVMDFIVNSIGAIIGSYGLNMWLRKRA